jgi:outer membrane lipoprotein SlyB
MTIARFATRLLLSASLAMSGIGGCATGGGSLFSSVDASDACGKEHAAFADSKSFYLERTAEGAILGALGGAALGALTAKATGQNVGAGAAIGAGVGTVAGGAAGYYTARQQQAADQASLSNSVYGDVSKASAEIDRASTTFGLLRNCRFAAADRIRGDFGQNKLSRDQAALQLADHKRRFDDELKLARDYGAKMADQDQQFRFASDNLVKQDPEAQKVMTQRAAQLAYTTTAPVKVRAQPATTAATVDSLSKGQRVRVTPGDEANDWRQVSLKGDQTGYVPAKFLAPPGTVTPPPTTANKNVQVAVAATETIPEKRAAYGHAVDDAAKQSNLTFNLDHSTG